MFKISRSNLDSISKSYNSKKTLGETNHELLDLYKQIIWNIIDLTNKFSVYEMSHWINNKDRWIYNRNTDNRKEYHRSCIVIVDLGATNFRYEPSFAHPCIVLVDRFNSMLIAPCSSKKYGKGLRNIIDAKKDIDGFSIDTGIQIESIRWVHKNRVVSIAGHASPRIMEAIDKYILSITPAYRREKAKIKAIKSELITSKKEIEKLNNEIKVLKLEHKA